MAKAVKKSSEAESPFAWGVREIGRTLGLSERQAFHLLENGRLPAKKVGGRWVAVRSELVAAVSSQDA